MLIYFSLCNITMPEIVANPSPDTLHDTGGAQQAASGTELHIRALATKFSKTQMVEQDGGLLIKGVPMLAAGTWTDSAVGTPLNYPEATLREYASNWIDTTGWSRHLGGIPRDVTDKVAEIREPRFENGAVMGDIFVHGATQKSRDLMEMVKRKLISYVSVEHGGDERFNPRTRQMEASTLSFLGFAFVHKGACTKCRINEAPQEPVEPEEIMPDTKELESQVAELTRRLSVLETPPVKVAEPAEVKVEVPKELTEALGTIKNLSERLEKLEKAPAPTVTSPGAPIKELTEPETVVQFDRNVREVGGMR